MPAGASFRMRRMEFSVGTGLRVRVLVTNTRCQQAYAIMASLRPHAERIVVTTYGRHRLAAALAPPARSRLVDASYRVPTPPVPWLEPGPTPRERHYVEALLAICRRESLDLIMPSRDEVAYILARHRDRFIERGTAVPVCDFPVQARLTDKWESIQAAKQAGIPVPQTHLVRSWSELEEALADVGLPAVVKPRLGSGGQGLHYILSSQQIRQLRRTTALAPGDVLVQEYIPGTMPVNSRTAYLVMSPDGRCPAMFPLMRLRCALWHVGIPYAALVSLDDSTVRSQSLRLLRSLAWWGSACLEWKRDPRDGRTKLLDANARMGASVSAACAAGVDLPLILAKVTLGMEVEPEVSGVAGRLHYDPVMEVLSAVTYLANRLARRVRGPHAPPPADMVPPLPIWLRGFTRFGRVGRRTTSDHWRALARDPLPPILHWLEQAVFVCRRWRGFLSHR